MSVCKKRWENWFEDKENFKRMEIPVSNNISDIILVKENNWYKNLTTKKEGSLDWVKRDRNFILLNDNDLYFNRLNGYYLKWHKELDILIFLQFRIVKEDKRISFQEYNRTYIRRTENGYEKYGNLVVNTNDYNEYNIDLCGQSIQNKNFFNTNITVPIGAEKTIREFFGSNCIKYKDENHGITIRGFTNFSNFLKLFDITKEEEVYFGSKVYVPCNKDRYYLKEMPAPIPEAEQELKKYLKIQASYKFGYFTRPEGTEYSAEAAIIDRIEDKIWFRLFMTKIDLKPTMEYTVEPYEVLSFPIDDNIKRIPNRLYDVPVVWMCDLKGSILEYVSSFLEASLELIYMENRVIPEELLRKYNLDFMDDGFDVEKSFKMCLYQHFFPTLEKLFKQKYGKYPNWKRALYNELVCGDADNIESAEDWIKSYFPRIQMNSHQSIYEGFCIPKKLFDMIEEHLDSIYLFEPYPFSNVFSQTDETAKYLMNMNEEEQVNLYEAFFKNRMTCRWMIGIAMIALVRIKGPKNWKGYMEMIIGLSAGEKDKYLDYLKMLDAIGEEGKKCDWKFKNEEELDAAIHALAPVYSMILDKKEYARCEKGFKNQQDKWEAYCYKNEMFSITYPKNPSDMIQEGICLHHCAKKFIDKVADGETTILFIRQNQKPDKPFYTLEIRDDAVRQCHGFDNKDVESTDLADFLADWCEEKNVIFSLGRSLCEP